MKIHEILGYVELIQCKHSGHGGGQIAAVPFAAGNCVVDSDHFTSATEAIRARVDHNSRVHPRLDSFIPPRREAERK